MNPMHLFFAHRTHRFGWAAGLLMLAGAWNAAFAQAASPATAAEAAVVSISFVGDVMLADRPGRSIANGKDPFLLFEPLLARSDIRVANLECVVATVGEPEADKPWTFRAHPRTLQVLRRHIDAVSLANNHSGDFGPQAFAQMLGLLKAQGVAYFGGGYDLHQAHQPLVLERQGLKIAFLGYNEFFPRSFEANFNKPGIAWSEDEQVVYDVKNARAQSGADIVIAMMHWGWEHEPLASARQRQLARLLIDSGADAVIGAHPHVVQNVEHYKGKPIVYSLGNFIFDGFRSLPTTTGWMLQLDVDRAGARSWRIFEARIDPQGTPRPSITTPRLCWNRAAPDATLCVVAP